MSTSAPGSDWTILENRSAVEIQYDRCITREGNRKAQDIIQEIFEPCDSEWRGMGIIPDSGYDPYIRRVNPKRELK